MITPKKKKKRVNYSLSEFDPEYKLVASSYQKTKDPSRVFFGHLDFKDGQAIYQKVYLIYIYIWIMHETYK